MANDSFDLGGGTISIGGEFTVPRMGYGAMRLTGDGIWGDFPDHEAGIALLQRVKEIGIRLVDTSDAYGPETNESLIADALFPYNEMIIATKGGLTRSGPNQWSPDGRPAHLRQACEASLKRLNIEQIDLYQFHRPDPAVPYQESIEMLAQLQSEGKIRHIGISNVTVDELRIAQSIVKVASVQNRYNLSDRDSEDVLQACEKDNIVFFPWYPVASGELARKGGRLNDVAKRHNATPAQISLAWLLQHSPVMLPIPGTSSIAHLMENAKSANIKLTSEDVQELESAAAR